MYDGGGGRRSEGCRESEGKDGARHRIEPYVRRYIDGLRDAQYGRSRSNACNPRPGVLGTYTGGHGEYPGERCESFCEVWRECSASEAV